MGGIAFQSCTCIHAHYHVHLHGHVVGMLIIPLQLQRSLNSDLTHNRRLASHKRSLTHHPSSQGWASRCPLLYFLFVWAMVGWVTLPFFSFCFLKASVLCICILTYMYMLACSSGVP